MWFYGQRFLKKSFLCQYACCWCIWLSLMKSWKWSRVYCMGEVRNWPYWNFTEWPAAVLKTRSEGYCIDWPSVSVKWRQNVCIGRNSPCGQVVFLRIAISYFHVRASLRDELVARGDSSKPWRSLPYENNMCFHRFFKWDESTCCFRKMLLIMKLCKTCVPQDSVCCSDDAGYRRSARICAASSAAAAPAASAKSSPEEA